MMRNYSFDAADDGNAPASVSISNISAASKPLIKLNPLHIQLCIARTAGASTPYKRWSKCTMEKWGGVAGT